jgi:hypothetical protein
MESWASSPAVRKSMLGNKRRDTKIELSVRRLLHARGLRYRVDFAPRQAPPRRHRLHPTARRNLHRRVLLARMPAALCPAQDERPLLVAEDREQHRA